MGLDDRYVQMFADDWKRHHGYVCFKKIPQLQVERTSRYVSKYITKMKDLDNPLIQDGKVQKPRKLTSIGYGMPTKKRFDAMRRDVLGKLADVDMENPFETDMPPQELKKNIELVSKKLKYHLNGKEYKLPAWYRRKMLYVKDPLTGKARQSALSNMVSKAVQDRIQKDFAGELIKLAYQYSLPESDQVRALVSKNLCDSEARQRQDRAQVIFETNIAALRKSKF